MIDELRKVRLLVWDIPLGEADEIVSLLAWESGGPPGCLPRKHRSPDRFLHALDPAQSGHAIPSRQLALVWQHVTDGVEPRALRYLKKPSLAAFEEHLLQPSEARPVALCAATWAAVQAAYADEPYDLVADCLVWCYKRRFFYSREDLTASDAQALVDAGDLSKKRIVQRAQDKVALHHSAASKPSRDAIPDDVKLFVWRRDHGRCVRCGAQSDLEFDHVIPLTMGGSNTERNLQILCASCNRSKGANLV